MAEVLVARDGGLASPWLAGGLPDLLAGGVPFFPDAGWSETLVIVVRRVVPAARCGCIGWLSGTLVS